METGLHSAVMGAQGGQVDFVGKDERKVLVLRMAVWHGT